MYSCNLPFFFYCVKMLCTQGHVIYVDFSTVNYRLIKIYLLYIPTAT